MRVAIYARKSTPHEALVSDQLDRAREAAHAQGWTIVEELSDDGISGWERDARRPGFERVLELARERAIDVVVVRALDRLARRNSYAWVDLETCGVRISELGSPPMTALEANVKLAIAQHESDVKSGRQLDAEDRRLKAGKPPRGGFRHFGYHRACCPAEGCPRPDARVHRLSRGHHDRGDFCDGCVAGCTPHTPHAEEAAALREVAERWLAGASMRSLANELNERGLRATTGNAWNHQTLRRTLLSPRLAGWRVHRRDGEERVVRLQDWTPIFSDEEHARLVAAANNGDSRSKHRRASERYALTGLLVCGREDCGETLNGQPHAGGRRRYSCAHCYRNGISADAVDAAVWNAALARTWTAERLGEQEARDHLAAAERELTEVTARREELDDAWASGELDRPRWARLTGKLSARADELRERVARLRDQATRAADQWANLQALAAKHADAAPAERARIMRAAVERIVLEPVGTTRGGRVDLSRLTVTWADGEVQRGLAAPDAQAVWEPVA